MYFEDVDGEEIENPVSIVKKQVGSTVHSLDMEIYKVRLGFRKLRCMINETTWEHWRITGYSTHRIHLIN